MPQPNNNYDKKHLRNIAVICARIDRIFNKAAEEAALIGATIKDDLGDRIFSFSDYPQTRKQIDALTEELHASLETTIVNGIDGAWALSNGKNDDLVRRVFGRKADDLSEAQRRRYFNNNAQALKAFLARKTQGLGLSDRVWRYTDAFKNEIELGLDLGIRSGKSAAAMTRDLRQYLQHPDKLFRRVRDEHGLLKLSQAAKDFHPGRGVYRSSYMNARRLAATETNIAYRTADHLRWQKMDFVVGIEIVLSNNHTIRLQPGEKTSDLPGQMRADGTPKANAVRTLTDICDTLAGRYPKDFKFTGWHPHCRCHAVTILKTEEEMARDTKRILDGRQPSADSTNSVTDTPEAFKDWVEDNRDRIKHASSVPYFIRDNAKYTSIAAERHAKRTAKNVSSMPTTLDDLRKEYSVAFRDTNESEFYNGAAAKLDYLSVKRQVNEALSDVGITDMETPRLYIEGNGHFSISFQGYLRRDDFLLTRDFYDRGNDGIMVEHSLFELPSHAQGKGVSKKILGIFFEQYKRMGVVEIRVCANIDVGGYTWARYGFCAYDKREALQAIRKKALTAEEFQEARSIIDGYYKKTGLSKKEPFPMYLIADKPWGKKALLNSSWQGVLSLKNPAHVARFEKYLRS